MCGRREGRRGGRGRPFTTKSMLGIEGRGGEHICATHTHTGWLSIRSLYVLLGWILPPSYINGTYYSDVNRSYVFYYESMRC